MYEEILRDVYKQWVEEFDHEAAFKRHARREKRELRFRSAMARLRRRAE